MNAFASRRVGNVADVVGSGGYVTEHLAREYSADALATVDRLHAYAGMCKVLRNHIHDGILPVDLHPEAATAVRGTSP